MDVCQLSFSLTIGLIPSFSNTDQAVNHPRLFQRTSKKKLDPATGFLRHTCGLVQVLLDNSLGIDSIHSIGSSLYLRSTYISGQTIRCASIHTTDKIAGNINSGKVGRCFLVAS